MEVALVPKATLTVYRIPRCRACLAANAHGKFVCQTPGCRYATEKTDFQTVEAVVTNG